jgi:hypothetical protein
MSEIPFRLARRPRDDRGYAVPFAQFVKPDGKPDFRVMDHKRVGKVLRARRCGLCGEPMRKDVWFIGGPKCVEHGYFYDPPMHEECARYAIQTCPHLARSKGKYAPVPDSIEGAGLVIQGAMDTKKAEWFGLMKATGYTHGTTADGMMYVKAELPWVSVERWRDGKRFE